jgi:hypothetical protein
MKFIIRFIITAVAVIFLLAVATIALGVYGYNQLETDFDATNFSPEINTSPENIIGTIVDILTSNYLEAAFNLIDGVRIDGTLSFSNNSFIPLYIPEMEHQVYIEGQQCQEKFRTPSFWLGPSSHRDQAISLLVDLEDVPEILLQVLVNGGTSNVQIYSEFSIGTFTIVKESTKSFSVNNSLVSFLTGDSSTSVSTSINVSFTGWYVDGSQVTTAEESGMVTARVTLSDGDSGAYTIRIRRDVSAGTDQTVQEESFSYDGSSTSWQMSFTPPYATGESSTNGYHIDILKDGETVWTMDNNYPPRLIVAAEATAPLLVDFDGWYVGGSQVTTAEEGDTVTAKVTLSDGDSSAYNIRVRRDVSSGADQTVQEESFSYDGLSTNQQVSFVPPYATGESSTNGYHIDVLKDNETIWTMVNDYPPRLNVAAEAVVPLSVDFNGWYVSGSQVTTAEEGDMVTARVTLSNGDSGAYTIRIRRDVSAGTDQTVQDESFSYDGSPTDRQVSSIPPYATGESSTNGYHIDVLKESETVWTMANNYPPRLRVTMITGGPLSISFDGWFVNGSQITTANKGDTVTAVVSLSGGEADNYTIQIRRDISFGADEIVKQASFSYDGSSLARQVSYIPPYATGESSTNGYHIDILKDGSNVWSMTNNYPPRLRVS